MTELSPQTPIGGRIASIDALRGFDEFWISGGWRSFTFWPLSVAATAWLFLWFLHR